MYSVNGEENIKYDEKDFQPLRICNNNIQEPKAKSNKIKAKESQKSQDVSSSEKTIQYESESKMKESKVHELKYELEKYTAFLKKMKQYQSQRKIFQHLINEAKDFNKNATSKVNRLKKKNRCLVLRSAKEKMVTASARA